MDKATRPAIPGLWIPSLQWYREMRQALGDKCFLDTMEQTLINLEPEIRECQCEHGFICGECTDAGKTD